MNVPQTLFILGPPRSFTTVVSAMLGQHPQMYGLPELHLFGAETIAEWWQQTESASFYMAHGLLRTVAQLYFGAQTAKTISRASGWLRRRSHYTTGLLYEELAERVTPRLPIEKSPSTVYHLERLQRAYTGFPHARFLHLVRHPRGHCHSVFKAIQEQLKFGPITAEHWLQVLAAFPALSVDAAVDKPASSDVDPQRSWFALHDSIVAFLKSVPDHQKLRMRGEDFLTRQEAALTAVTAWLGLPSDKIAIEEMRHPERSPYACIGPPGARFGNDHFFLRDPRLRPRRAEQHSLEGSLEWCSDGRGFLSQVKQLAREFGYE